MATNDKCCTIVPYFKVHSGKIQEFRALCEQFVGKTKDEAGCPYYGFSFDGDQVHCREGYRDADAAIAHLKNVDSLLPQALNLADVLRLEIHGPEAELSKLRAKFDEMNMKPQCFTLEYGFRR
jgi:quinol monooxygenase YgiN